MCVSPFTSGSILLRTRPRTQEASDTWDVPGLWPTLPAFPRRSWATNKSNARASNKVAPLRFQTLVPLGIWVWRRWGRECVVSSLGTAGTVPGARISGPWAPCGYESHGFTVASLRSGRLLCCRGWGLRGVTSGTSEVASVWGGVS